MLAFSRLTRCRLGRRSGSRSWPSFLLGTLGFVWFAGSAARAFTPTDQTLIDGSGADVIVRSVTTATDFYFVGVSNSSDLPVTDGSTYAGDSSDPSVGDIVVGRVALSTGQPVWLTYLGGSASDFGNGIDLNNDGTLTIGGWTTSTDFPVTENARQSTSGGLSDAIIAQFNAETGALVYATYVGGSGDDQFSDLAYLPNFSAWAFGGFSNSQDFPFPETNGASVTTTKTATDTDGLFVGMSDDGNHTIELAGFHRRGTGDQNIILGVGRDLGSDGFWITGTTTDQAFWDTGFDTSGKGGLEVFVNRIAYDTGARRFSKFVGGSGDDTPLDVEMVDSVNVIVVGTTTSTDYPTSSSAIQPNFGGGTSDGFIHRFSTSSSVSDGTASYFGGAGDDAVRAIARDANLFGAFHFGGVTSSTSLPAPNTSSYLYSDPGQPDYGGGVSDGFVGLMSNSIQFIDFHRLTFAGGPGEDGITSVSNDLSATPSDSFTPHLPLAAGTYNYPAASPGFLPGALPGAGRGIAPTIAEATARSTTAAEAFWAIGFLLGPPAAADLQVGAPQFPAAYTQVPYGEAFDIVFPIQNNGPDAADNANLFTDIPVCFKILDTRINGVVSGTIGLSSDEVFHYVDVEFPAFNADATAELVVTVMLITPPAFPDNLAPVRSAAAATTTDPNIENNLAQTNRAPRPGATDLGVRITFDKTMPSFGERVGFEIVITNHGSENATNITVGAGMDAEYEPEYIFDPLPAGVTITPRLGGNPALFTVKIEALPFLESVRITGSARMLFSGDVAGAASVASSTLTDTNNENDSSSFNLRVDPNEVGKIHGKVFADADGDNRQDEGEPGLNTMFIEFLETASQEKFGETHSFSNGEFFSPLLPATNITVRFHPPEGLSPSFLEPLVVPVTPGEPVQLPPLGFTSIDTDKTAVAGFAFLDTDNDGERDEDENGAPPDGVMIYIDLDQNGVLDDGEPSTTPDETGFYRLFDLAPATFDVRSVLPALLSQSSPAPTEADPQPAQTVEGTAGNQTSEVNFGIVAPTDLGIDVAVAPTSFPRGDRSTVTITITNHGALAVPRVIASIGPSSGNDRYVFRNANSGTGYAFLANDSAFATIDIDELAPGQSLTLTADIEGLQEGAAALEGIVTSSYFDANGANNRSSAAFSITAPTGEVSGEVYDDQNGNGVRDDGEPGLGGRTVVVTDSDGQEHSVTTNPDGTYVVGTLPNGEATVTVTPDSGDSATTGGTGPVTVSTGTTATGPSFGLAVNAAGQGGITGVVFDDQNSNGVQDAGEPGLAGITVYLVPFEHTDPRVGTPRSAVTRADGEYTFSNIEPSTHYVRLVPGTTQIQTTPRPPRVSTPADLPPAAFASVLTDAFVRAEDIGLATLNADAYSFSTAWFHFAPPAPEYSLKPAPTAESLPYTYDGNQARLQVTGTNSSASSVTFVARLVQANGGELPPGLAGTSASGHIPAGGSTTVTFDWDTDGLAWLGVNPAEDYLFRVELSIENTEFAAALDAPIDVRPRPIIAAHGLWSSAGTWHAYPGFVAAERDDWEFYPVGDGTYPGLMDTGNGTLAIGTKTVRENAQALATYVEAMRNDRGAVHFDLVVHSMGGLISRRYLQSIMPDSPDEHPLARNLVMLGTPNEGSDLADIAFPLLYARSGGDAAQFPYNIFQLKPFWVKQLFNPWVTQQRDVPFSIAAGDALIGGVIRTFAVLDRPNDGIVAVDSALAVNTPTLSFANAEVVASNHLNQSADAAVFSSFVKPILSGVGLPASSPLVAEPPHTEGELPALEDDTQSLSFLAETEIAVGESASFTIAVSTARAVVFILSDLADVPHTISDAGGNPVSPTPELAAGTWGSFFRQQLLEAPTAGDYTLTLTNNSGEPIVAMAAAVEIGAAQTLTTSHNFHPDTGAPIISAQLDPLSPAPATVTAALLRADAANVPFTLLDDGLGDDAAAGDGIYTATLGELGAGLYTVSIDAELSDGAHRLATVDFASLRDVAFTQIPQPDGRVRFTWSLAAGIDAVVESDLGLGDGTWIAVDVEAAVVDGQFELVTDLVDPAEQFRLRLADVVLDEVQVDPSELGHSADINRDFQLDLSELLRVIELYNTRNGTQRTGRYRLSDSSEDGFTPESEVAGGTTAGLARFHSADVDRNAEIDLSELLRVIELYNTRTGTTRTGRYRFDAETEDGFSPAP